jgi:hypothetical protein
MLGIGIGINRWSNGGVGAPIITGFAYPMETLTASRAGQWAIDGIPIIGQTGSTFVVPLLAYGRTVTCDNSAPVVVWKPWDIAGVVSVRVADRGVLNAVSPDVVATDGQTIRRWNGLVSAQPADQTVGVNQPIFRATGQSGNPSVEFDGINDGLVSTNTNELSAFNNRSTGYMIIGCRDTNPTGGSVTHSPFYYQSGATLARALVLTRQTSSSVFRVGARRLDADVAITTTAGVASDTDYHVHTAEMLWSNGVLNQRLDGSQVSTANFPSSGNTSPTNSGSIGIGFNSGATLDYLPGHICCTMVINQLLSATDRSRLERFVGLFGGLNIPLV